MVSFLTLLLLAAFLCFLLASIKVSPSPRISTGWLGVALAFLAWLLQRGIT